MTEEDEKERRAGGKGEVERKSRKDRWLRVLRVRMIGEDIGK